MSGVRDVPPVRLTDELRTQNVAGTEAVRTVLERVATRPGDGLL